MARYFIDTDDDDLAIRDDEGIEFPDIQAARDAAHMALPDMARQKMPDGDRRTFKVSVRDSHNNVLYIATLVFSGEWKNTLSHSQHVFD
ncbi:hypothetical protein FF100_36125 [Methylobacterium terricola]|uniref:DUF6894 domain-containing protein n=1 Tax=Methylobacterium terricola TaxID=2583531 RepID=A0A5C4L4F5_9HYPH|nr:hypothetical protein [Methylobacterium terricola]TNC05117.1 hypothetical protein FF100_36125 [Methylobacterium terricola]